MDRRRLIASILIAAALLAGGVLLGAAGFQRTTTKVVIETRTVTVEAAPSAKRTLHVSILDPEPRQTGASSDTPFPLHECQTNARFPSIADIAVHEPVSGGGLGTLVGLPDNTTVVYSPLADEGVCVMEFDITDLAPSRFYIVHADSETRLFEGGYNWRLSAGEIERNGWSIRLKLPS